MVVSMLGHFTRVKQALMSLLTNCLAALADSQLGVSENSKMLVTFHTFYSLSFLWNHVLEHCKSNNHILCFQ